MADVDNLLKQTLKEEINYRIELLRIEMKKSAQEPHDEDNLYWYYANEHSIYSEVLNLVTIFENRIGFEKFKESNYTPIKDYITKEPLKIGDKVENSKKECGILQFDDYTNRYVIKTEFGHIHSASFTKIDELYDYSIDNSKVECRNNPHKKKW